MGNPFQRRAKLTLLLACGVALIAVPGAFWWFSQPSNIHEAARLADIKSVRSFLADGISINKKNHFGETPLFLASEFEGDSGEMAQFLIDSGADLDHRELRYGFSPLHNAIVEGNISIAAVILENGGAPDVEAIDGLTPLHLLAGRMPEAYDSGKDFYKPQEIEKRLELGRILIFHGADVNRKEDLFGRIPLHFSAQAGMEQLSEILLEAGSQVNEKDKAGWTPLYLSQAALHLSQATNSNLLSGFHKDTAFTLIAAGGTGGVESGAPPGIALGSRMYELSLHEAARAGTFSYLRDLLRARLFHVNDVDAMGYTSLHHAQLWGNLPVILELVDEGADLGKATPYGWLPVHVAASQDNLTVFQKLIEAGADPYAKTTDSKTVYDIARDNDSILILRELEISSEKGK